MHARELAVVVPVAAVDVDVHHVCPVFERGAAEEREHRAVGGAEVPRVVIAEEAVTGDGEDVEDEEEQPRDVSDRL